jgi:hypothetical protein
MATLVSSHAPGQPAARELTPERALRYAWYTWLTMLAVPFVFFLYVVHRFSQGHDARSAPGTIPFSDAWFLATVAYMVVVVPAFFFVRSRYFKRYWTGECVPPRNYLTGMTLLWASLEVGGLLSMIGCLATRSLMPCLLPAIVGLVMFLTQWPNGRAMVCKGRGATDDPETYEEPR